MGPYVPIQAHNCGRASDRHRQAAAQSIPASTGPCQHRRRISATCTLRAHRLSEGTSQLAHSVCVSCAGGPSCPETHLPLRSPEHAIPWYSLRSPAPLVWEGAGNEEGCRGGRPLVAAMLCRLHDTGCHDAFTHAGPAQPATCSGITVTSICLPLIMTVRRLRIVETSLTRAWCIIRWQVGHKTRMFSTTSSPPSASAVT